MERQGLKVLIFCATLLFTGVAVVSFNLYRLFYQPMLTANITPVIICIDKNTSASSVVHLLKSHHYIKSERLLLTLIRLQDLSHRLKAGIYEIKSGESALHFLYRVAAGDVLTETFHIIEGTTQAQVSANLNEALYLTYSAADWQAIAGSFARAEGLLLADTYHYDAGSQSMQLLDKAHANLQQFLSQSFENRSAGLPYKSAYEMLIAASILEKEASIPEEKRLIAGIIINRLRKNMPLQMDPTVIYALGTHYTGKLKHEDLHIDSPYNTYLYRGLPPTPIAMVGKEAILAAAHPLMTNYLYFVARGDGSHYFSANYDEQKKAVNRYIKK